MKKILGEEGNDGKADDDATVQHTKAAGLHLTMPPFKVKFDDLTENSFIKFSGGMK